MTEARKHIVIVGAGGHGRVVLDICRAMGECVAGFLDSRNTVGTLINDAPVLGNNDALDNTDFLRSHRFIVAIGDQQAREALSCHILNGGGELATAIHPSSVISPRAVIGDGTVVVAGAIVNTDATVGRYCIINTGATIDHDVVLEDGVQICPGANLAGAVHCGRLVFIGTGAVIIPKVHIGSNSVIGAGAVVLKDIPADVLAVGNPAKAGGKLPS